MAGRSQCSSVTHKPPGFERGFRGVAIFAKAFMGIPAQQAAKITRPLMPSAAPAVLLHSLHTQQGVCNIVIAMTRRDFVKPAFSLRIKRFVKTHALSLLGTTRLLSRSERCKFSDRKRCTSVNMGCLRNLVIAVQIMRLDNRVSLLHMTG